SLGNEEATRITEDLLAAARDLRLEAHLRLAGSVDDVRPYLAAADALVSASSCEGLSLAQIEALAMDLPVVAARAGGTAELARNPAFFLLSPEASPGEFAGALARIAA